MSQAETNGTEASPEAEQAMELDRDPEECSYKDKYRDLKSTLKYLVYENESFNAEMQQAQAKLLELSYDKSYLLDQLLRYEPVLLSDQEDDMDDLTDISASDDDLYQASPLPPPTVKSSGQPSTSASNTPLSLQRPTESAKSSTKPPLKASKRQLKPKAPPPAKVAKTTRQRQTTKPPPRAQTARTPASLVVKLPRKSASKLQVATQEIISVPQLIPDAHMSLPSPTPPPRLPTCTATLPSATLGTLPSSSSGSSSSSSDSDSDDSTTSSSETRNSQSVERDTVSPVQMVAEAKTSNVLLRPKAITSPVKTRPPSELPSPLLSPLLSPTGNKLGWTKIGSSELTSPNQFSPIGSNFSPPTGGLPFAALGKTHKSAFQLVRMDPNSELTHSTENRNSNNSNANI